MRGSRRVADEARDQFGRWIAIDFDGRGREHDIALMHDADAISHAHRLDLIVGDVDRGVLLSTSTPFSPRRSFQLADRAR